MQKVAIIPARSGSKRLPKKNIIDFNGRPIIELTIQAAIDSNCFSRVIVSTDDEEITRVVNKYDVEIHERSEELANDSAKVSQVCIDVLDCEEYAGNRYEIMACLYATAPLRNAQDIQSVVNLVKPGKCDYALAVTKYSHPPHQALKIDNDGKLSPMWPDMINKRAESIETLYVDNGSTYAVYIPSFRSTQSFYGAGLRGHVMPYMKSVDIDFQEDYELAKILGKSILK